MMSTTVASMTAESAVLLTQSRTFCMCLALGLPHAQAAAVCLMFNSIAMLIMSSYISSNAVRLMLQRKSARSFGRCAHEFGIRSVHHGVTSRLVVN
jgi:uncharacterized membrane protein YphA (DoxX/SURF4 family)